MREDTAAFIFSESGIEEIITAPGGHTYQSDKTSASNAGGIEESFIDQAVNFFGFGSRTPSQKQIAFVNLREIRGIKFGTRDPLSYNDLCYGTDLKIFAFGTFSIKVTDAEKFIRNYVPANVVYYSFNGVEAKERIMSEFLRFFADALSALSATYRILLLPPQMNEISRAISADSDIAETWQERFGFEILEVDIQNMEFSEDSRELVLQYS